MGQSQKCEKCCTLQNNRNIKKEGDQFKKELKIEGLWGNPRKTMWGLAGITEESVKVWRKSQKRRDSLQEGCSGDLLWGTHLPTAASALLSCTVVADSPVRSAGPAALLC